MAKDDPQVNFRLPAELRDRVQAAANASKRTLTQEIVRRLESAEDWPALRDDIWQAVTEAAEANAISFAQQVERDLLFAHAPLLVRVNELLKEPGLREDIARLAEARGVSFQDEVVDRIRGGGRSQARETGLPSGPSEHLSRILKHIEELKSANDEARARGYVLGASMTAIAATDKNLDSDRLNELVENLRALGPEDLKDSLKAEALVLGLRSSKRRAPR